MNSTLKLTYLTSAVAMALFAASCGSGESGKRESAADSAASATKAEEVKKVFYSVPSPMELASLLQKSGSKYDAKLLNDVKNVSKYSTNDARALNLGIYGSDLSYTSVFNQTQETMFYMESAKRLSDELGISSAFNKSTIDRIQENIDKQDSLMVIISGAYYEVDAYLQENERQNISTLVICGGWIEGLHLATQLALKSPKNTDLQARIIDQKMTLESILNMLSAYPEDEALLSIANPLLSLKQIYDGIKVEASSSTVSKDPKTNKTVIGADAPKQVLTLEQLKAISDKIEEIRNGIIN